MKTSLLKTMAGTLIAGLVAAMAAGPARAEDAGVVRLGGRAAAGTATLNDNATVSVRGQSEDTDAAVEAQPELLQLLGGEYSCAADACDTCCSDACDSCCSDACDSCCTTESCDGCDSCGGGGCGKHGTMLGWLSGRKGRRGYRNSRGSNGYSNGGYCNDGSCGNGHRISSFLAQQCAIHNSRKWENNARLNAYLRCKLGYFIHDGCGGVGCKPFGQYSIVYPDNPAHFDGRDGQVYAAQGVGGPVSVPLAPNVRHAYNYGWGIPSSRLTPISNATH